MEYYRYPDEYPQNSEAPYSSMGRQIAYKGDIFLYLDKDEIAAFLPLLPLIKRSSSGRNNWRTDGTDD